MGGLATDIAVDGQIEIVTFCRRVEARIDEERDELQVQRVRVADVLVQAVVEIDESGRNLRRSGEQSDEGGDRRRLQRRKSHLRVSGLIHDHV